MGTEAQNGGDAIACSLEKADLATRHRDVEALFADGLTAADHYGDLLELRFRERYGPRVQALAAAERECCPFMEIEVRRDGGEIVLSLDCPPEAGAALNPFAELAAQTLDRAA